MKKIILFLIFIILNINLINAISIYPLEINSSTEKLFITNLYNEEIELKINSKILNLNDKYYIDVNETLEIDINVKKSFRSINEDYIEIIFNENNLNYFIEIPIELRSQRRTFPILIISSIIVGISVVFILKKFWIHLKKYLKVLLMEEIK